MARSADKKVAQSNAATLRNLRLAFLVANAAYILGRMVFQRNSYTTSDAIWWAVAQVVSLVVYWQLAGMATPTYGREGEILSGGEDLSGSGLIGYMMDVVYIGLFVTVGVIFTDKIWKTYWLIPIYAGYKGFTKGIPLLRTFLGAMPGASGMGQQEAMAMPQGRAKGKARKVN